ncbi:hypothetical protein CANCADRAFT_106306 [Tortispora caseinolytica NRRL Y-17796]|uniref:Uncharacterized protein n=1 Tax=Tortispora caseinolytica NRRL Y-17796 TaxID=767744 RepID=A0A1E4TF74_9ASCO|nr:hypothetical protein CANCADRAFT_106306 [Tortispora caseinolytica NRRL Y-17796]
MARPPWAHSDRRLSCTKMDSQLGSDSYTWPFDILSVVIRAYSDLHLVHMSVKYSVISIVFQQKILIL